MRISTGLLICCLYITLAYAKKPLQVALYYESLCPGCQEFMKDQLVDAWSKFQGNVTLDLLPFGNAEQSYEGGKWKFTCQHGVDECVGNKLHACAIDQACNGQETSNCDTDGVTNVLNYIVCVESSEDQMKSTVKCAKSANLDGANIKKCAKSAEGNTLLNYYGNRTAEITHEWVPWVTINGKHDEDAEANLESEICKLRPKLCK